MYYGKVGRFFTVDPLTRKYPELTPYQFASNTPIAGIDFNGGEFYYVADGSLLGAIDGSTEVMLVNQEKVKEVRADIALNNFYINKMKSSGKKLFYEASISFKSEADKMSVPVGLKNEELNVRAFLSMVRKGEGTSCTGAIGPFLEEKNSLVFLIIQTKR